MNKAQAKRKARRLIQTIMLRELAGGLILNMDDLNEKDQTRLYDAVNDLVLAVVYPVILYEEKHPESS